MNSKKTILHKRLAQLPLLVIYMTLINVVVSIVGYLTVPSYTDWLFSELRADDIIFITTYAICQVSVFSIKRISNIVILGCLYIILGLILLHNDYNGYGWEICQTYTFCVSKLNHLFGVIIYVYVNYPFAITTNVIILFPIYLTCVALSFRWILISLSKRNTTSINPDSPSDSVFSYP